MCIDLRKGVWIELQVYIIGTRVVCLLAVQQMTAENRELMKQALEDVSPSSSFLPGINVFFFFFFFSSFFWGGGYRTHKQIVQFFYHQFNFIFCWNVTACWKSGIFSRTKCLKFSVSYTPQTLIKLLQQVQNSAAKLMLKSGRAEHCKPLLKQLHWLPIEQRIKYKTSCLCYQIITGTAPQYLAELVHIYVPSRSLRSSSDDRTFRIPTFMRKQHDGWAFCFSAAQTWNSLPFIVCHSPSLPAFKSNLKTHLFKQYFD